MRGAVTRPLVRQAFLILAPDRADAFDCATTPEAMRLALDLALARYRSLVKRHHPDQGGDPRVFIAFTRARDVINRVDPRLISRIIPNRYTTAKIVAVVRIRINGVEVAWGTGEASYDG